MRAKAIAAESPPRWSFPVAVPRIARFVPSRRSLLVGSCIVAIAAGGYAIARETSLFAIERIDVTGGSNAVDAQVARALAPLVGKSLVGLDGAEILRRTKALSTVASATYDRSFPNTLRVKVVPENPVAVLRSGALAWVVSAHGRAVRSVDPHGAPKLPRMWIAGAKVRVGGTLPLAVGRTLTRAITAAGSLRARIGTASLTDGLLVFHLRSGRALVLGAPTDIPLKVAVAEQVLQHLPWGTRTIDVSVPSRPVTSLESFSS
jgi:cell division protein FtsQ